MTTCNPEPQRPSSSPDLAGVCEDCREEFQKGTYYLCNSCAGQLLRNFHQPRIPEAGIFA
jgi:rRNA maturation endonuclease Nob1